ILYPIVPLHTFLLALLDQCFMVYCAWNAIRMCLFAIQLILIPTFVYSSHLSIITAMIEKCLKRCKIHSSSLERKLAFFRLEHCAIYFVVQHINSQIASTLMLVTFATNILINALLVRMFVYEQLGIGE